MQEKLQTVTPFNAGRRRLTPSPPLPMLDAEGLKRHQLANLARLLAGNKIAIAPAGLGPPKVAHTVRVAVRLAIFTAQQEQAVAYTIRNHVRQLALQQAQDAVTASHDRTPTAAPPFDGWSEGDKPQLIGVDYAEPGSDTTVEMDINPEVEL